MRQIWAATCLTTFLLVGLANAADQAQNQEAAKGKAEVLEEKASAEGSKMQPTPAEIITKPQAQSVDPTGEEPLEDAITCLARTIYWEANRKDDAEMEAIANVVMNRLGHKGFPNTICGVVKQGHEQGACQFSWWCDGRPDDATEEEPYSQGQGNRPQGPQPATQGPKRWSFVFPPSESNPKLVQRIYQDGRGRGARLLQAGWRQGQIGSVGEHRQDFETL